jgi:class 3 adenylate cyclase
VGEAGDEIPAEVAMLAMRGRHGDSFVITIEDARVLHAQRTEAATAKARSEELLYEILPRAIVQRLNGGETDISFVVESATVAFIDIEAFSAYAAPLQPQSVMRSLSTIFEGYDRAIVKHPLCQKMKYVGDVFMMAAGLFAVGIEPEKHAEQSVRFCIDCLKVIDEANHELDANLAVRIGINTGGPLTAGVLGSDKPLFDIIGDPINVAARLQTTGPTGKVQVSEATYGLLSGVGDIVFEPRGEVMLKGKGRRPAFLVSLRAAELPPPPAFAHLPVTSSRPVLRSPRPSGSIERPTLTTHPSTMSIEALFGAS